MTEKSIAQLEAEIAELRRKVVEKEVQPLETLVAALQSSELQTIFDQVSSAIEGLTPGRGNRYRSLLDTIINLRNQAQQDLSVVQQQASGHPGAAPNP